MGNDINPDPIYRNSDAAAYLGVSAQWLNQARVRGEGPNFVRVGAQRIGYRRSQLDAFIAERTNAPYELPSRWNAKQKRRSHRSGAR